MPASRSARAITLAPRSWPSSPGFAMMTRVFVMNLPCIRPAPESPFYCKGHSAAGRPHACHRASNGYVERRPPSFRTSPRDYVPVAAPTCHAPAAVTDPLNRHRLVKLSPQIAQRAAHFTDCHAVARAVDERGHDVVVGTRHVAEPVERPLHAPGVPPAPPVAAARHVPRHRFVVDLERLNRHVPVVAAHVHPDNLAFTTLDLELCAIGAFGNPALRQSLLDGGDHAPGPIDYFDIGQRLVDEIPREPLHEPRPAERIDRS